VLQAALVGLILVGIYRFMKSGSEYTVDWYLAFAFTLIPYILILFLIAGLNILGLPEAIVLAGYVLYLVVPFLILKFGLEFTTSAALKFSSVVPVVVVAMEVLFFVLFEAIDKQ
jgi:hypothetical protein